MANKQYVTIKPQGFTLVELSIVIVIIGFLIAGVSTGQSLIKQAQVNAVINDLIEFKTATNSFTTRFGAVAGDFEHGYSYWGAVGNCTNTYVNDSPYDGCNGNGDENLGPGTFNRENLLIFKHLNLVGVLEGNYSGTTDDNNEARIGIDVPAGPMPNSAYYAT